MDEVGRGTSVNEGVALAFATAAYLYQVIKCRGLFATHFHELSDLLGYGECKSAFPDIGFFCSDLDESEVCS
jgi:DNA mismatch repair ATPase MutS